METATPVVEKRPVESSIAAEEQATKKLKTEAADVKVVDEAKEASIKEVLPAAAAEVNSAKAPTDAAPDVAKSNAEKDGKDEQALVSIGEDSKPVGAKLEEPAAELESRASADIEHRDLAVWSQATNGVLQGYPTSGGYFDCTVLEITDAGAKIRWLSDSKEEVLPLEALRERAKFEGKLENSKKWNPCHILEDGHKKVKVRFCYDQSEVVLPVSCIRDRGVWVPQEVPACTATKWEFKEQSWKDWNEKNHWKNSKKQSWQSWQSKGWKKPKAAQWQEEKVQEPKPEEKGPTGPFAFLAQPVSLSTIPSVFNVLQEPVQCVIS